MLPAGGTGNSQPALIRGLYGYEIERICWRQPHAIVCRALRKVDALPVLVKLLQSPESVDWRADWFQRDYQTTQGLGPNCVLKPLALEQTDRGPALVYADEGAYPLEDVASEAPLAIEAALTIGASLAEAVAALHKERLIHCNLNPTTLWLRDDNKATIADLGCARHLDGDRAREQPPCDDLIDIRYMSPEQTGRVQHTVDHRTDIYALGIVLYRLLSGILPFDGADPLQIIDGHVARQPTFPSELKLPTGLADVVLKALAKSPEARYLSASGLVADLLECRSQWQSTGTIGDFEPGRYDAKAMLRVSRRLYGRERETARLLDKANSLHGKPAMLFIKGPPGVGKSTLLSQLEVLVRKENGRFVSGKFDQYKRNVPYMALIQALQQLIGQLLSQTKDELEVWRTRILEAVGSNVTLIVDVIPELELITGLPPQPPPPDLPPVQARNRFNHVFTSLIYALARHGKPLCLVMDDLQWVDAASLTLLSHVLTDNQTRNILFVGAYRDNEVEPTHPLETTIRALRDASVDVTVLPVGELQEADVLQLVCDTFAATSTEAGGLAQVLHAKSGGNALYLSQFIPYLCDEGLVAFDYGHGKWVWDLPRIQQEGLTHDVLELLHLRFDALQENTRTILATAACVGSTFAAAKVAAAAQMSTADTARCLTVATREGLIVAEDDHLFQLDPGQSTELRLTAQFRFLHDRVQEAAFDSVPDEDKKRFRLEIGRRLLAAVGHDDEHALSLYVLGNLNFAWELIVDDDERRRVAQLNLAAGHRARQALAYQDALGYVNVGLSLLGMRAWRSDYELAFELHSEAFEAEYLTANFSRAEELFKALIANARSKLDKARIYRTKILLDTSELRYEQAITVGVAALKLLDVPYLRKPSKLHLIAQLGLIRLRMRGRSPQELLDTKALDDAEKAASLRILMTLIPPAYYVSPDLFMFTAFKVVNYSLRDGISPPSAVGFGTYGVALGALMGNTRLGYEFGRLAVKLAEKSNDPSILCKVLHIFAGFIKGSRDSLNESFPLWQRARQLALETGDHEYCNYAICSEMLGRLTCGSKLDELFRLFDEHCPFVLQSKEPFSFDLITICRNFALALRGETAAPYSLSDGTYDEAVSETRYRSDGTLMLVFYQCFFRLELACLFGRAEEALDLSDKCDEVWRSVAGTTHVAERYFYRGMSAVMALGASGVRTAKYRRTLRDCLARLNAFAANCPHNFGPHAALLEAEAARLTGEFSDALKHYNRAIEFAEAEGLTHIVALAHERAGIFCLADEQRRLASWYLAGARAAYDKWGATAKTAWLDREYAALFPASAGASSTTEGALASRADRHLGESFDVAAALQASRIIASGENTEGVLTHLMQVIRLQIGAESAHLLVLESGKPRLEASATADSGGLVLFPSASSDAGPGTFSPAIVNYVLHTGDDLSLVEAGADARFSLCTYVASRRPKTVFCSPIRHQGELLGVIYLEHTQIARAFTGQKLEWLRLLATEVGLTVWSARLSRYRDYVHKFAPAAVAKEIDSNPTNPDLAAKDCDVSILFGDLAGYTRMAEQMERRQLDELINRAFSRFVDEIHRYEGTLLEIRGDEIFVLFGDEDPARHVRKAASAALAISRAANSLKDELSSAHPPIVLNMGINSGVASVGMKAVDAASGARWRYGASGTVVNVAARVRELARDGSILISAESVARVPNTFEFKDLGEHTLKNVMHPVRIYRLLGERTPLQVHPLR